MARRCEITGKGTIFGRNVPRKGQAKKLGGAGQHIVNKTSRKFKANIIKKNFYIPHLDQFITLKISVRALRSITKIGLEKFLTKNGINIQRLYEKKGLSKPIEVK